MSAARTRVTRKSQKRELIENPACLGSLDNLLFDLLLVSTNQLVVERGTGVSVLTVCSFVHGVATSPKCICRRTWEYSVYCVIFFKEPLLMVRYYRNFQPPTVKRVKRNRRRNRVGYDISEYIFFLIEENSLKHAFFVNKQLSAVQK